MGPVAQKLCEPAHTRFYLLSCPALPGTETVWKSGHLRFGPKVDIGAWAQRSRAMSALCPGCVKTPKTGKRRELISSNRAKSDALTNIRAPESNSKERLFYRFRPPQRFYTANANSKHSRLSLLQDYSDVPSFGDCRRRHVRFPFKGNSRTCVLPWPLQNPPQWESRQIREP